MNELIRKKEIKINARVEGDRGGKPSPGKSPNEMLQL